MLINDFVKSLSHNSKFKKATDKLELYTYNNAEKNIDEFVDLIIVILELLQGNINLKETVTSTNYIKILLEREESNKEYEIIKLNNIIVFDGKVL